MVMYIACCKDRKQASEIQDKLASACPTLIFSRVLEKKEDLDVFNAAFLNSQDEMMSIGILPLNPLLHRSLTTALPWKDIVFSFLVGFVFLGTALLLGLNNLTVPDHPLASLILNTALMLVCAVLGFCLIMYGGNKIKKTISADRKALWRMQRWLKRGDMVVIAASEDAPEHMNFLPREVSYFDRYQKSA